MRALGTREVGVSLATESYIHIKWPFITFLAAQLTLFAVFLFGLVIQTAVWKVPVAKGSALAMLFAVTAEDKALLEQQQQLVGDDTDGGLVSIDQAVHPKTRRKLMQDMTCKLKLGDRGWSLNLSKRGEERGEGT